MPRPLAVAITGGIGAGKSTALASFRRHGAATVSSDEIVHHLLATDPDVKEALVERLGEDILGEDGVPDRERIAHRVFKDREALLYEVGAEKRFDKIVVVTAPTKLREARRGGRADDRETRLIPDREKAKRADFTYVNTGSPEELDAWVAEVMATLTPA